jgi:diguanylate cyclase (GGDEF)-like protein
VRQAHLRIALAAVSSILLILVPIAIATAAIADTVPLRWGWAVAGVALVAIPLVYLAVLMVAARRGPASVQPPTFFVLVTLSAGAIVCAHMASHPWSGNSFVAMLVLPCIAFAVVTTTRLMFIGWAVAACATAGCLAANHLAPNLFWTQLLIFASIDLAAALAVGSAVRTLTRRSASRAGLQQLTGNLGEAPSIEAALTRCLPLVTEILPCSHVVVYARGAGAGVPLRIAQWSAPGAEDPPPPLDDVPTPVEAATIIGSRCYLPAGHADAGELVMVIDGIDRLALPRFFAEEAANGLSSSLLMMSSRIAHVSRLEHESRTDALTGLANRRALEERLVVLMGLAGRSGAPLSVAMIDLDRFKDFNDRHGHQRGDELLQKLSSTLAGRLRTQDLLARYGGEEFCLVLPDTGTAAAHGVLEDLRIIAATIAVGGSGTTISAGAAQWIEGEPVEKLLARADRALYEAKAGGRDRVVDAALY